MWSQEDKHVRSASNLDDIEDGFNQDCSALISFDQRADKIVCPYKHHLLLLSGLSTKQCLRLILEGFPRYDPAKELLTWR